MGTLTSGLSTSIFPLVQDVRLLIINLNKLPIDRESLPNHTRYP
jgi:hypothetical protein